MLSFLFIFLIVVVAIVVIGAILVSPFILIFVKPKNCPACDRKVRLIGKSTKCNHCKTKLFKHANGEYMVKQ